MKALVSVLMCVYNTPISYLREAVHSILRQSFIEYEFIIVDDGSDSIDVRRFIDTLKTQNRVIIVRNERNIGLTKSLNIGLKICKGKYIARMDSDDVSNKERLKTQFEYLENHLNVCVLGSDISYISDDHLHIPPFIDFMDNQELFKIKMLFRNVGPIHPSTMIRRSFLLENNIRYRESELKAQDYGLWLDCINVGGTIVCLKNILLGYRVHREQITISHHEDQDKCIEEMSKDQIVKLFDIDDESASILASFFSNHYCVSPERYIESINTLIRINKEVRIYNEKLLRQELMVRWIHKVIKCALKSKDFRGFAFLFTYRCILSKAIVIWARNVFLGVA